ncbi:MAG: phosphate acyltransferase [Eubacteriales bacterium]|nr:phosphate acyltransferase [Eubacteriales bacterium]
MRKSLEELINSTPELKILVDKAIERTVGNPIRVAIPAADAENILKGVFMAQEDGFVDPILIGSYRKINETLERIGMADRKYDLHPISNDINSVQYAIEMIKAGSADMLMRGNTQTRDFLLPVLNKANHLIRPGRILTHIVMLKIPTYDKLLALSDVTLLVHPSIEMRKEVVRNMVDALHVFGVKNPNIALLSLIEKPAFHMKDTVEAQTIVIDHNDSPIAPCNLVGPITWDLIVSKEAARLKGYDNPACGDFHGVVVQNLMNGNLIVKVLQASCGAHNCGILIGANIPIAITGRSESPDESYLSLAACAAMNASPIRDSILPDRVIACALRRSATDILLNRVSACALPAVSASENDRERIAESGRGQPGTIRPRTAGMRFRIVRTALRKELKKHWKA